MNIWIIFLQCEIVVVMVFLFWAHRRIDKLGEK